MGRGFNDDSKLGGLASICILSELVHAAFSLPRDGLADAGAEDYQPRDYQQVRLALPPLPFQYYREVFDALDLESAEEVCVGDLYDDLADIYHDLSEGLFVYHHVSPAEAKRYWSQSFGYHWGEHATSALRAFYCSLSHTPDEESAMNAKKKAVLDRIESFEQAIAKAREYLESGKHAHWSGFRPVFVPKLKDGKELPPHKDWVKNVFLPRMEKALRRAEILVERLDRNT